MNATISNATQQAGPEQHLLLLLLLLLPLGLLLTSISLFQIQPWKGYSPLQSISNNFLSGPICSQQHAMQKKLLKKNLQNVLEKLTIFLIRFIMSGSGWSARVEHSPRIQEFLGLIPAKCWRCFQLPSSCLFRLQVTTFYISRKQHKWTYISPTLLASMAFLAEDANHWCNHTKTPSFCEMYP